MVLISSLADQVKSCRDLPQARCVFQYLEQGNYLNVVYLANLVVEMYGKCGSITDAKYVFDRIRHPNIFSWTVLFEAYARNGHSDEALDLFKNRMPMHDTASSNAAICVYVYRKDVKNARALFDSMFVSDIVSWSIMITGYAHSGYIDQAKALFDQMPRRNVVAWTAMVAAYAQTGHPHEARKIFDEMPETNLMSWNIVLHGFADAAEADQVAEMFRAMPDRDVVSWNTLIAAYARVGHLSKAKRLLDRLPEKSVVSWNSSIQAWGMFQPLDASGFSSVCLDGTEPDSVTFTWILNSYCSRGDLKRGLKLFFSMSSDHGVTPVLDHYNTILNALGRAGLLEDLIQVVEEMSFHPDFVSWKTLLLASTISGCNHTVRERATQMAMTINSTDENLYILLSQ